MNVLKCITAVKDRRNRNFVNVIVMASRYGCHFWHILFLFYFELAFVANNQVAAAGKIEAIAYPVDTTVFVGDTVVFTCTVREHAEDNQTLDWFIEWDNDTRLRIVEAQADRIIHTSTQPEFTGRGLYSTAYSMTFPSDLLKLHNCTLTIKDVTIRDKGYFGCTHQINPTDTHRTLLKDKIRFNVLTKEAGDPHCTQFVTNGIEVLTCVSEGGIPTAKVTWYEGNDMISNSKNVSQTFNVQNTTVYRMFVCTAQQATLPPKNCSITVNPVPVDSATTEVFTPMIKTTTTAKVTVPTTSSEKNSEEGKTATKHSSTKTLNSLVTRSSPKKDDNSTVIIGAVVGASFLLILILLLLLLLLCRKKNKKEEPKSNNETPLPELPTLERPPQPVEENPYGDLGETTVPRTEPESDFDYNYPEKPWQNNPDLMMAYGNDGFSDTVSLTESEAAIDGQLYENYMASRN